MPQEVQKAQLDAQAAKELFTAQEKIYNSRQELFQQGAMPRKELDQAGVDLTNARNQYEIAQQHLDALMKIGKQQQLKSAAGQLESAKGKYLESQAMLGYTNKQISTAQMIAQLLELAKWVRESKRHGEELGLNNEETAFYDALAENGSAKEVMKSDQLRLMARHLAEMVRKMPKLDWTQRESVRADLRRKVRRLLAMYGYPPDLSEDATQLVLKQAELSTEYAD